MPVRQNAKEAVVVVVIVVVQIVVIVVISITVGLKCGDVGCW